MRLFKLHIGCGGVRKESFVNIDARKEANPDVVCDCRKMQYVDGSVSRIETYHLIEHLDKQGGEDALKEWYRVLCAGGILVIECPDLRQVAKQFGDGNDIRIHNLYGLQRNPFDSHLYGYSFELLKDKLQKIGYSNIERKQPTDYHAKEEPCMRVECVK